MASTGARSTSRSFPKIGLFNASPDESIRAGNIGPATCIAIEDSLEQLACDPKLDAIGISANFRRADPQVLGQQFDDVGVGSSGRKRMPKGVLI